MIEITYFIDGKYLCYVNKLACIIDYTYLLYHAEGTETTQIDYLYTNSEPDYKGMQIDLF